MKQWLTSRCKSEEGKVWVSKMAFGTNYDQIQLRLTQTGEMLRMLVSGEVPNRHFYDIKQLIIRIKVPGTFLEGEEYLSLAHSVEALAQWLNHLQKEQEDFPELFRLSNRVHIDASIVKEIDKCIDDQGQVRDSASSELSAIRKRLGDVERSARSALQRILKKSISDDFSTAESQVTLRDGRLVIPIKAEFKRNIAGLIHDESATGQTVYLEPSEALELNNEVRELKNRERREVIRILTSLADHLRIQYSDLEAGSDFLGKLDFIHSKASWATEFGAIVPKLQKNAGLEIKDGVHPLLWHTHQKNNKPVVPLSIRLDGNIRMIVVSGPNAGGKSVVLKTVGLLQYLVQCGVPVPVHEASTFGIFSEILLDIGDTQSIEDDLSTYSAHLSAMRSFVQQASKKTLVLIDEFGKGTEPQFGGAMAEAILERLAKDGCFGVITTHYQNLKDLADRTQGIVNGAMKYDLNKLEPLFQLEVGKPGSSFAFEIAAKIGLPKELVESAKQKVGKDQVDFDKSLNNLQREKQKYDKLVGRLEKEQAAVQKIRKDYEELKEMLDEERREMIRAAKQEAKRIVADANKEVERAIREIKESQADKVKTMEARKRLLDQSNKLHVDDKPLKKKKTGIQAGDQVRMNGHDGVGEIIRIKGNEAEVQFGLMKSFVKLERLEKVSGPKKEQATARSKGYSRLDKMMTFSHELVIRGMRAEEALPTLDTFVDEAILLGVDQVKVIHGKGHGILRDLLRNHLWGHPHIAKIEDDHADRGGSGISIVTFK